MLPVRCVVDAKFTASRTKTKTVTVVRIHRTA